MGSPRKLQSGAQPLGLDATQLLIERECQAFNLQAAHQTSLAEWTKRRSAGTDRFT